MRADGEVVEEMGESHRGMVRSKGRDKVDY